MLCVECGAQVARLYTRHNSSIRLETCKNCHKFADKYVELDPVLVALDFILLRERATRHVVYNVFPNFELRYLIRTYSLIVLFDVYIQWAYMERTMASSMSHFLQDTPVLVQYASFLVVCSLESLILHTVSCIVAYFVLGWKQPKIVSIAVLLSSMYKLVPVLTLIWDYSLPEIVVYAHLAVSFMMLETLATVLNCSYLISAIIAGSACLVRWVACDLMFWHLVLST